MLILMKFQNEIRTDSRIQPKLFCEEKMTSFKPGRRIILLVVALEKSK